MKNLKTVIFSFILVFITVVSFACFAGNTGKKVVALTFDDGPHLKYTEGVLDILKKNNIKATFFVMGGSVHNHPELLKAAFLAGNDIGNHTYSHPNLSKLGDSVVEKELTKDNEIIYKTIHVYPVLFRPPYGACGEKCTKVANRLGYKKILWNFLVNDWDVNKTTSEDIAAKVIKHAASGAILGMHDGGGNREKTVAALPVIIQNLKKQGYKFVTVSELLHIKPYKLSKS